MPRIIFVGDTGRLVVPLGEDFSAVEPFVVEDPENLPERPELIIRRIELERRGGTRLLIDFVPFTPGTLYFPSLDFIPPGQEPLTLSGLRVQVASVLNPAWMDLSGPAPPMAVPGTGLLVYGSISLILLVLFLGLAAGIWGKRNFRSFWRRMHRRHLLRVMLKFLRRMGHEGSLGKSGNPGYYLSLLAAEFREFLSVFTGINCRSLTPLEFLEVPLTRGEQRENPAPPPLEPALLCGLFRNWDTLRFSGRAIEKSDLLQAVKETENLVLALDREERQPKPALKLAAQSAGEAV